MAGGIEFVLWSVPSVSVFIGVVLFGYLFRLGGVIAKGVSIPGTYSGSVAQCSSAVAVLSFSRVAVIRLLSRAGDICSSNAPWQDSHLSPNCFVFIGSG